MPLHRLTPRHLSVFTLAIVVTCLDALTKAVARFRLAHGPLHVAGPLWWRLEFNSGISFSLWLGSSWWTGVVTTVVTIAVAVVALRTRAGTPAVAMGLVVGGGVGNVVDRLTSTSHHVTDFVAIGSFPVFNLADAALTVGFALLMLTALRGKRILA